MEAGSNIEEIEMNAMAESLELVFDLTFNFFLFLKLFCLLSW